MSISKSFFWVVECKKFCSVLQNNNYYYYYYFIKKHSTHNLQTSLYTFFLYLFICISSYRDWHKPFLISSYYICLYVILITHNSILLSVLLVYFLFCLRFFLTKPTMLWPFWLSRKAAPNRAITQGQLYLSECIWQNLSHYLIVSALGLVHLFK